MPLYSSKPWFNGPSVGAGISLPRVWQGWAVLAAGILAAVLGGHFLHGIVREIAILLALVATWATIRLKRGD